MTKHVNFAQIEKLFKNEIKNEIDDRDKILLKKSCDYINDNDEITQKYTTINVKLFFFWTLWQLIFIQKKTKK